MNNTSTLNQFISTWITQNFPRYRKLYEDNIKYDEIISFLNNKIIITSDNFKFLIDGFSNVQLSRSDEKRIPTIISKIIDIYIHYGYELKYDDMLYTLKHGVKINNIQNYNFTFDMRYIYSCCENMVFPYGYQGLEYTYDVLLKCCKYPKCEPILNELLNNKGAGLQPDVKCVQELCNHSYNTATIKQLCKYYKIKLDDICWLNICKNQSNIIMLKQGVKNKQFDPTIENVYEWLQAQNTKTGAVKIAIEMLHMNIVKNNPKYFK